MSKTNGASAGRSAFGLFISGLWSALRGIWLILSSLIALGLGLLKLIAGLLRLSERMRLSAVRKGGGMIGKCWRFGDDVNTDEIIPARYLNMTDPAALAQHCMEDADKEFVKKAKKGDIIVAGKNFGCGSSREHAPIAIKAFGISCVIAHSFARIFFRNAINMGFPIVECPQAAAEIKEGDEIQVALEPAEIKNLSTGKTYKFEPFPKEMQDIIKSGGLMDFVKKRVV